MRRHRHILVAVDGSETSFHALSESLRLARWSRGTVTATIVSPPYQGDLSLVGVGRIGEAVFGPLEETLHKVLDLAESRGVRIDTVCRQGEMCETLSGTADSAGSDLVVLGVDGKPSFLKLLVGDTVSGLLKGLRGRPIDVLVIPDRAALEWERILFFCTADDLSGGVSDRAIEVAVSYGGSMMILGIPRGCHCSYGESLYAEDDSSTLAMKEYLNGVRARAADAGVECEVVMRRGGAGDVVRGLVKECGIDVVVTASRGRTGFRGLWTGEGIEGFIYNCGRPVLVLGEG